MKKNVEIEYIDIDENKEYEDLINKVIQECFKTEKMENSKLYISFILTNPKHIREYNKQYRKVDKETDVLSFPMFEKNEIEKVKLTDYEDTLGDIIISIERVEEQAKEYGHSFERELAYMVVHGFYHLMGEDHMNDEEKKIMREKEEIVLNKLNIVRD